MKRIYFYCCLLVLCTSCAQEKGHTFQIKADGGAARSGPVFMNLGDMPFKDLKNMVLMQEGEAISFQVDNDKIWFVHDPRKGSSFRIEQTDQTETKENATSAIKKNGDLQLGIEENRPVVSYRYEMTYPPEGVDSLFAKSGYIHPIVTPKGDTLSRIQPPDHYHHYGLWGPWTHTRIDTALVDFWNLGLGMGTVRFKEFKASAPGTVFSSFTAIQEHVNLKTGPEPQVALNEELHVKLWNLNRPDRYMLDYTTKFSTPLENGILFEAYRYGGGIGMRFTERWNKDNCDVLTSEGKDRLTADGTNARWAIVKGESSDGAGTNGILFMSYPKNRMHPEPMRIWPIDGNNGRGDMFFEFCPIRHEEWQIEADKEYGLTYRMVIFEDDLTALEAEAYWQNFAKEARIKIKSN